MSRDAVAGDEEEVDGEGHPEGEEDIRDEKAGVEVRTNARGEGKGGVQAATVRVAGWRDLCEETEPEGVGGEEEAEGKQGEWEPRGPVVGSEEVHGGGGDPIHERRFIEEADAVHVGSHEVVPLEHLAGDLDVDGINVIQQARREQATDVNDQPDEDDERDGERVPTARGS